MLSCREPIGNHCNYNDYQNKPRWFFKHVALLASVAVALTECVSVEILLHIKVKSKVNKLLDTLPGV